MPHLPQGPDLLFSEEKHRYCLVEQPHLALESVTAVVDRFSHPFNIDEKAGKRAYETGTTAASVRAAWAAEGRVAADLGTAVHAEAERIARELHERYYFTTRPGAGGQYAQRFEAVHRFYADHPELAYGGCYPETRIVQPDLRLAGTVDLLCRLDGLDTIVDFKTNKRMDMFGFGENMYWPLNKWPDSPYWHYALQLNLYDKILRDVYGYEAEQLMIIWLRPDGQYERHSVFQVPDLIEKVITRYLKRREADEQR